MSERTIRRYESGEVTPTLDVVESFAKLIGKTIAELMEVEGESDERKRRFLDDVWDAHLAWFDSSSRSKKEE